MEPAELDFPPERAASFDGPLPGPFVAFLDADPRIVLQVKNQNGRMICSGVIVGFTEDSTRVSRRFLRELDPQAMLDSVANDLEAHRVEILGDLPWPTAERPRYGYKGLSDEQLREIGSAYVVAKGNHSRHYVQWMCRRFGVSRATMHRWLNQARSKGFIGSEQ